MTPPIKAFPDRPSLWRGLTDHLTASLQAAIEARGSASIALSGGTTPGPLYEQLARAPLDWSKVTLALVDERFVPPNDPGSNEGLVRRTLGAALAQGARFLPMYSPGDVESAAARADALYAPISFDVAVLGMGGDGHTASWFPGSPQLREALDPANTRAVIAVTAAQGAGASQRLTLTLSAMTRVARPVLLITGEDKRARLERAYGGNPAQTPVSALFSGAIAEPEVYWAP